MRILILGGTLFLGRAVVDAAMARGHRVTLFNRGQTAPGLYPELEHIRGDRTADLSALDGRSWDAVVDTSTSVPSVARRSAQALAGATGLYCYVSSVSAYAGLREPGIAEDAPLATLQGEYSEVVTGESYGALKALCEAAVTESLPDRTLVIRPGLIVGPHDPTDRYTYWPVRIAQGGQVLAPGRPDRQVQYVDVRDLGEWMVAMLEAGRHGVYNATGPAERHSMADMLAACAAAAGGAAGSLTWVDDRFLLERKVEPWMELPLWLPETAGHADVAGMLAVSIERAVADGLRFRPASETARDTLAWAGSRPQDHVWRAGMRRERELELLRDL